MRFAVISDIHSNLEAFNSALADIEKQNVDKICCLGDLLGYGPNPIQCVDKMIKLVKEGKVETCLMGNHDQATQFDPEGFNQIALAAVFWTRKELESQRGPKAEERWDFIGSCPRKIGKDCFLFVHGSPFNPLNEYVFPDDVDDKRKMDTLFKFMQDKLYCFIGHTHVPGVFVDKTDTEDYQYFSYSTIAQEFGGKFKLGSRRLLINVGSIGQPRDHDPRSCYVVVQYDPDSKDNYVEYRRVEYNIDKTVADIQKIGDLKSHDFLWNRIQQGR